MMMSLNTSQEKSKLLMTHYYMKKNIEDEFFHTWSYLHLCATAGIVINDKKFKFCRDTVEFAGLNTKWSCTLRSYPLSYKELS